MKKTFVIMLAMLFTLCLAVPAFAAVTSPFSDVPAGHWAYDAVSKLVKDGLVEGYNGRFAGDNKLTRYEMAEITANVMTKIDQANAEDTAIIKRLQTEFAEELNKLDIRVERVEKKSSSIKFTGDSRLRYRVNADQSATNLSKTTKSRFDERIRLNLSADFADHWTFLGRIEQNNYSNSRSTNGTKKTSTTDSLTFERAELDWKNGDTVIQLGRFCPEVGQGQLLWAYPFAVDGFYINKNINKVSLYAGYADLSAAFDNYTGGVGSSMGSVNALLANVKYRFDKNANVTLAYLDVLNPQDNGYKFKQLAYGTTFKSGEFTVTAEGITNRAADLPANAEKSGYYAKLQWKGLDLKKPGSWSPYIEYMKLGNWAIDSTYAMIGINGDGGNGIGKDGAKGYGGGIDVVLTKDAVFTAAAYILKPYDRERTGAAFDSYKNFYVVQTSFRF